MRQVPSILRVLFVVEVRVPGSQGTEGRGRRDPRPRQGEVVVLRVTGEAHRAVGGTENLVDRQHLGERAHLIWGGDGGKG